MSPTTTDTTDTTERPDDLTKLTELAKNAVDTAVGLGVLGLQKLQVGRVELQKLLTKYDTFGAYTGLRSEAIRRAAQIDSLFAEAIRTVESTLNPVTDRLPGPAKHVATVAQTRIDELHGKVSEYLAKAAAENAKAKVEAQA